MEKIKIGRIVNAVALRGEVKVYNYSGYKERYEELDRIIVENKEYEIEGVFSIAADANSDGIINSTDYLTIKKHFLKID